MNDLPVKRGPKPRDPAFAAAWTLLRNGLRSQDGIDPNEQFGAYRIALEDLPGEDILEAAKRIVRRDTFMPAPAQIREEVAQVRADRERAKSTSSRPSPGKTQRAILDAAGDIVRRTMSAHADHVDRLVAKSAGKLDRPEVLGRIEYVLYRPAYEAACAAILGNGTMPQTVAFEAYNQKILEDLAGWARLPATNSLRPGRLAEGPAPFARPATPQNGAPAPDTDIPAT